jgi:hypothetical protein
MQGSTVLMVAKVAAISTAKSSNVVCPGGASECPSGQTCCSLGGGQYGCCKHVAHWEEGSTDVAPYQMQFAVQMINTVVRRDTRAMLVKELATCRDQLYRW